MAKLRNTAPSQSWVRTHTIDKNSNRLTTSTLGSQAVNYPYDPNGNMQQFEGVKKLLWNDLDNIQTVMITDQAIEYYVYNSKGQRLRKVLEQQTGDKTIISDSIYLGGFEISLFEI